MKKAFLLLLCLLVASSIFAGGSKEVKKSHFGYIVNGVNDFWILAQRGVEKAEKDFDVKCEFLIPPNGTMEEQKRFLESLTAKKVDGVAITPIASEEITPFLNEIAKEMPMITFDSDAPKSSRICYIGTNNYIAGRSMGKLIKEAVPAGGEIMIFVGKLDVDNAIERRQGIIDELKDLPVKETFTISAHGKVECGKYTILDTKTDNVDKGRAKQNAEDTLIKYPNIAAMVGLWGYNAPMILSAVKDANLQGKRVILSFDELDDTLQGIKDGYIYGTVVQDPYNFGYKAVEILVELKKGNNSFIPKNKLIYIPERIVKKDNVDSFWADLKNKIKG